MLSVPPVTLWQDILEFTLEASRTFTVRFMVYEFVLRLRRRAQLNVPDWVGVPMVLKLWLKRLTSKVPSGIEPLVISTL